jgi:hypothetical protein
VFGRAIELRLTFGYAHCCRLPQGLGSIPHWAAGAHVPTHQCCPQLRIIHSVIRPVLEYGMEIWGQLVHLVTGTRKQGSSHPLPLYRTLIISFSLCPHPPCSWRTWLDSPGMCYS